MGWLLGQIQDLLSEMQIFISPLVLTSCATWSKHVVALLVVYKFSIIKFNSVMHRMG